MVPASADTWIAPDKNGLLLFNSIREIMEWINCHDKHMVLRIRWWQKKFWKTFSYEWNERKLSSTRFEKKLEGKFGCWKYEKMWSLMQNAQRAKFHYSCWIYHHFIVNYSIMHFNRLSLINLVTQVIIELSLYILNEMKGIRTFI